MDRERRNEDHQGSSLNVFVLGIVIGIAITLLFTTKKGRKILRALTDEGMDKINKWEDILSRAQAPEEDDEMLDGEDYVATEPPKALPVVKTAVRETITVKEEKEPVRHTPHVEAGRSHSDAAEEEETPKQPSVRRFFKRPKR